MSLLAQEVVERAGVELSRCIIGLGLKTKRPRDPDGLAKMGSVRKGGVMEKVANVFCGNSVGSGNSGSSSNRSKIDGKPVPPEKPSRFLLGKVRNGGIASSSVSGSSPKPSPKPQRSTPRIRPHIHKPTTMQDLLRDESFLNSFFYYFSAVERASLSQVCSRWKNILYQPRFWHGVRPVLNCREVRGPSSEMTAEMRKKFYSSVQTRAFDSLILIFASDEDLLDLVANYPVNRTKALRGVGLRCSSVSDKGLETLLDHLSGVYQLELQGCNELTEAGLWGCLNARIVSLSIADCINVADEAIGAVAQLLPSLYEFNLQAYHVTDASLSFFSPRQTNTLCILRLHSCWELTNHAIVNIVHALPNITVLSLSGCSKITDEGIELIAENLRKLRSLDLSWCPRITDAALEYIACDLNQLEELTLDRCSLVTDIGVGYVSTIVSLNSLFLRWCSLIRDFAIQHLISMRNLHTLSLAGCSLLSSEGLSILTELRSLQELELTNCAGASLELYQHLHLHLPKCLIIE